MSRKLAKKQLGMAGFELLKIEYYQYMVLYFIHEKMFLDTAKSFQTILDTFTSIKDLDENQKEQRRHAFDNFVIFLMVSPYGNER